MINKITNCILILDFDDTLVCTSLYLSENRINILDYYTKDILSVDISKAKPTRLLTDILTLINKKDISVSDVYILTSALPRNEMISEITTIPKENIFEYLTTIDKASFINTFETDKQIVYIDDKRSVGRFIKRKNVEVFSYSYKTNKLIKQSVK